MNRYAIGAKDRLRTGRRRVMILAGGGRRLPTLGGETTFLRATDTVTTTAAPRKLERGRIGETIVRADGIPKVKGEFAFSSDLSAPGMLWGHTVRSPHAHARITAIDIAEALTMPGVHAILTHADIPGEKSYGLEFRDQPVLAIDRVRYFGEAVVLVAAEHPEQARRAADKVRIDYEPLPPVADMERAFDGPELHPDLADVRTRLS